MDNKRMGPEDSVPGDIAQLLQRWGQGDCEALGILASMAYGELRAIAAGYLRRENPNRTLQATGLVNELYLRLAAQRDAHLTDRRHFYSFAAMMMRRLLSDHARRVHALKRPGAQSVRVRCIRTWPGWMLRAKRCWLSIRP